MDVKIEQSWKDHLAQEFEKPYFTKLIEFVKTEYSTTKVYPPGKFIFNAFDKCTFDNTKVVILGQDPYHLPEVADGIAFSTQKPNYIPASLRNIFLLTTNY